MVTKRERAPGSVHIRPNALDQYVWYGKKQTKKSDSFNGRAHMLKERFWNERS